jgi:hypothetical protein
MARREIVDLEAKLFDVEKRGCLGVLVGPGKLGEIDYELHRDGGARMKISLKGARLPEGTGQVTVYVNETPVTDLEVQRGSGYLRLESARGDTIPEVKVKDTAVMRVGDTAVCEGTFHKD